jgi:signal transduction histidine kinase
MVIVYPMVMVGSIVFKPSITISPAVFPPDALAFSAYYLLRRRFWPVILLITTCWDFVVISEVTHLVAGTRPASRYVLIVSWASALACIGSALAIRTLRLDARARNQDIMAIPLLVLAVALGAMPGAVLDTWIHASTAHLPIRGIDLAIRNLSPLLTIIAIGPLFLGIFRGFAKSTVVVARRPELAGIGLAFTGLCAFYYFVPWSLDQFLELMLLGGPMLWLALRCSQRAVVTACAAASIVVAAACARGFGQFTPVVSLGEWRDGIVSCQVFLLIGTGGTMLLNRLVLKQRQLLEDSKRKQAMLSAYGKALDETEHTVRQRAAQDLHDGVAQIIAGQSLILQALRRRMSTRSSLGGLVEQALAASREAQSAIRATIDDLSVPEDASLREILASVAEFFQRRYAFSVKWQISGDDSDTARHRRLIYRALKELLMNAYKHSNAKSAEVMLDITANAIRFSVSDAGVGFDPISPPNDGRRRLGLIGLNDRIGMAGGQITVESSRGAGCRVVVLLTRFHDAKEAQTSSEAHTR